MAHGVDPGGVQPVLHQEGPVQLGFENGMACAQALHLAHVAVTGAVQGEMAEKAVEIRKARVGGLLFPQGRHAPEDGAAGLTVEAVAQPGHGVVKGLTVKKERVRPVETEIVKRPVGRDDLPRLRRQQGQHVPAEAIMGIGCWHGIRLNSLGIIGYGIYYSTSRPTSQPIFCKRAVKSIALHRRTRYNGRDSIARRKIHALHRSHRGV